MTNREIVTLAIKKAEKNGYVLKLDIKNSHPILGYKINIPDVIFSHKFAKALWGECRNPDGGPLCVTHNQDIRDCKTWEEHLQEMVLEENPLKYLKRFLE